jgi:hypothetical protein
MKGPEQSGLFPFWRVAMASYQQSGSAALFD